MSGNASETVRETLRPMADPEGLAPLEVMRNALIEGERSGRARNFDISRVVAGVLAARRHGSR